MRVITRSGFHAIGSVCGQLILLILIFLTAALISMELFSFRGREIEDRGEMKTPRLNFDNI